jgi:hypothetical protein
MPRRRVPIAAVLVSLVVSVTGAAPARAVDLDHPVRIYPLGSTVTVGCLAPGGYRGYLDELLNDDGVKHEFIGTATTNPPLHSSATHHDGHASYLVEELDGSLNGTGRFSEQGPHWGSWVTGSWTYHDPIYPEVTVIYAGETDIASQRDPLGYWPYGSDYNDPVQRATFVEHLTARLKHMVDKMFDIRPGSRIVLSNLVREHESPMNLVSGEYSAGIAQIVADEAAAGQRIVLADARTALAGDGMVMARMVTPAHYEPGYCPSPIGDKALGAVMRDGVEAALALP